MDVQRLITMVNDIARYFASEPEHEAGIEGVAEHLHKFWNPRMCEQLIAYVENAGAGLDPLADAAVRKLAAQRSDSPV